MEAKAQQGAAEEPRPAPKKKPAKKKDDDLAGLLSAGLAVTKKKGKGKK